MSGETTYERRTQRVAHGHRVLRGTDAARLLTDYEHDLRALDIMAADNTLRRLVGADGYLYPDGDRR